MNILTVFNSSEMLSLIGSTLVSLGQQSPYKLSSGREVLSYVKKHRMDVVFLDYMIYDINSIELLKEIKKTRPGCFVVMSCLMPTEEQIKEMGQAGVNAILLMPFNSDSVSKILKKCKTVQKKKPSTAAKPGTPQSKAPEMDEEKHKVFTLLTKYVKQKKPVRIEFDGSDESFSTLIINVTEKHVVMGKINPKSGHELAKNKTKFRVMIFDEIGSIEFYSQFVDHKPKDDDFMYLMPFPSNIVYVERRSDVRVQIGISDEAKSSFSLKSGETIDCIIVNLSSKGICLEALDTNLSDKIELEEVLENLKFTEGLGNEYNCKLKVVRLLFSEEKNSTVVAGTLEEMPEDQQSVLSEAVQTLAQRSKK